MDRRFLDLTMADVMHLAYQLDAGNGIKNQFCKRTEKLEGSGWKISYIVIHKFQWDADCVFSTCRFS